MSGQPSVLQVVLLRDGLLVGTHVLMPGQYSLGSGPDVDVHLEDPSVNETQAFLHFQNGRAAIQDAGSGGPIFVNGHRTTSCEVRSVDEIACGPFTIKVRVIRQGAVQRPPPSSDVASILAATPEPPAPSAPAIRSVAPQPPPPQPAAPAKGTVPPTVVSSRRGASAAPQPVAAPQARSSHLRPVTPVPVEDGEGKTEAVTLPSEYFDPSVLLEGESDEVTVAAPPPPAILAASAVARAPDPPRPAPSAPRAPSAGGLPSTQPKTKPPPPAQVAPSVPVAAKAAAKAGLHPNPPTVSSAEARGRPHLFVELDWGGTRRVAKSFGHIDPKKKLIATEDDASALPLWGFRLEGKPFVFAEQRKDLFRVYVPPGAGVERRAQDGNFYAVKVDSLEVGPQLRRCVTLASGHAIRLTGDRDVSVLAYVQPALPKPFVNPLSRLPWLAIASFALFGAVFFGFVFGVGEAPLSSDFQARNLSPVAVKLIAPPKPEDKKKLEEKVEKIKKATKKKPKKEEPKVAEAAKPKIRAIEKLTAAGPAMKDLLAAVDKLGSGPGMKNAKNNFKLSGLIGKAPIASAGLGTFGLGGGGGGGMGIKGAELLRGKGGLGIGALGSGRIGKGSVAGTVGQAMSRSIGAQGSIDKEAVAKVINSHLHEVSSCYERALLKTPGLAGKIVLEWQITTAGGVGFAKTKSSTMQSPAVESCILTSIKTWRFPPAKGAGVIITYPFMFNSVGY